MAGYRLIEDSAEIVISHDFFDKVAYVAHNCYQVSAKEHDANVKFVKRLINNHHLAMIEHYRFTAFTTDTTSIEKIKSLQNHFIHIDSILCSECGKNKYYISFSLRPLLEAKGEALDAFNNLASSLPEEIFELLTGYERLDENERVFRLVSDEEVIDSLGFEKAKEYIYPTYCLITDRGVTHELVRHRICSFAQESTRYCNYSKDKFENCLTFIKPLKYDECKDEYDSYFEKCAETYFALLSKGCTAQEARSVLPNCLKTSIMVTCNLNEWKVIFDLRTSDAAHPDIRRVITKVKNDMIERGLYVEEGSDSH